MHRVFAPDLSESKVLSGPHLAWHQEQDFNRAIFTVVMVHLLLPGPYEVSADTLVQ